MKKEKNSIETGRLSGLKKALLIGGVLLLSLGAYAQQGVYSPTGIIGTVTNGSPGVGIGTSTPSTTAALDVNGFSYFRNNMGIKTSHVGNYTLTVKQPIAPFLGFNGSGLFLGFNIQNKKIVSISSSRTGNPFINLYNSNGTVEMVNINSSGNSFLNGGNVGIGTATPEAKLHVTGATFIGVGTFVPNKLNAQNEPYQLYVKGGIITEEMKVELAAGNWADYVFEEDYELLSLEEVELEIKENGHLHNIESAEEIESKGLELKSITVNQQEKIEEIYLHLIEMNKEIKELKKENETLKDQIVELTK